MNVAMKRALGVVVLGAALAHAEENRPVTTTLVQDRARLAASVLGSVRPVDRGLALADGAFQGSIESPEERSRDPFDRLVASVNADTPDTSTVELLVRVRFESGALSDWLSLGWTGAPDDAARVPRSAPSLPKGGPVKVAIDTVELKGEKAVAFQALVVLARAKAAPGKVGDSPTVRRVTFSAWVHGQRSSEEPEKRAWGKVLDVPERSQCVEDPKISGRICSPTSLSMVLAFHGVAQPTSVTAAQVLDRHAQIYGNWALNVANAGRLGFDAAVVRMNGFRGVEEEILAGRPVVISHRWKQGELANAPIGSTDGHLIVVKGFTAEGDVVVNDPCADPRKKVAISRIYKRADIAKTWLSNTDGIAYVVSPRR